MSIGSWDPTAQADAQSVRITPALLERLVNFSKEDQLEKLEEILGALECQTLSGLMQIDHELWYDTANNLPNDDLLHLIRFFALAENIPEWDAMEKSPVIPLAKNLRKRGVKLDKDFLQWLRTVNSNRFLPYGPL